MRPPIRRRAAAAARRRPGVAGVRDQPDARRGGRTRRLGSCPHRRGGRGRGRHLHHAARATSARPRRRRRRAQRHEVPLRPLRRAARGCGDPRTRAGTAGWPASVTTAARSPVRSRRGWRCAGCGRWRSAWTARRPTPSSSRGGWPRTPPCSTYAIPGSPDHPGHAVAVTRLARLRVPRQHRGPRRRGRPPSGWPSPTRLWVHATSLGGLESTPRAPAPLGRRARRASRRPCSGCPSASRTSRTCGPTSTPLRPAQPLRCHGLAAALGPGHPGHQALDDRRGRRHRSRRPRRPAR